MEKMTFRQKIENFWYHNKFTVIVVGAFAIFIIISLIQLLSKDKPDANFMYLGSAPLSYKENLFQASISEVMKEDYNGDGKKYVDLVAVTSKDVSFNDTEGNFATGYTTSDLQKTTGETFAAHLTAGDSMIYLIDENYYGVLDAADVLMPLSEALGYKPEFAVNDYTVHIGDLDVYYLPGFDVLPKNTLLCIRYPVKLTKSEKEVEERKEWNLKVFRDIFSYVYPDKPKTEEKVPRVMTLEEFKEVFADYVQKRGLNFSEGAIESATEISPEGFYEETGANVFRVGNATYLAIYGKLYALGKYIGGTGLYDIAVGNMDDTEQKDIIFTYSYKSGNRVENSVSVFNLTTMKETFLNIGYQSSISIVKISDTLFELHGDGSLLGTVEVKDGKFEITFKDV
ncbi:MAG: hypothetical protein E7613_04915 [Ruminococcaceae bacterium]|nr:hypothetical protein [Oscillospiraceae bacterium]